MKCEEKRKYWSEQEANNVIARRFRKIKNGAVWLRSYKCPECNKWHLTKMPYFEKGEK